MEKHKVLVIEDDPDLRECLRDLLSDGYQVFTAADGTEGVQVARRETPNVIVLDIMMPKMNGYAACEELRQDQSTSRIPILMLTGADQSESRIKAFRLGADDFIAKPFIPEELRARVEAKIRFTQSLTDN